MAYDIRCFEDPAIVLDVAQDFLGRDPVRHNVVLTLLNLRVAFPEPGRYWIAECHGQPSGLAFQSPLHFMAALTPMAPEAVTALVRVMVEQQIRLPGVNGEAATAARFAGEWTERTKSAGQPAQGLRIYEVDRVIGPRQPAGGPRSATEDDRDLVVEWLHGFHLETHEPLAEDLEGIVDRRIATGQFRIWEDEGPGPVSVAGTSRPVAGVVRIGPVYTPPAQRNRGYAAALVASLSRQVRESGYRCILYADLGNPTSNSIYRAIGYRSVCEAIRYRFG